MEDIYHSTTIKNSFGIGQNKPTLQPITKDERLSFLETVMTKMPLFQSLQERLNQKMYPNAK